MHTRLKRSAALAAATCLLAYAGVASAETRNFDLPAMPASQAIVEFSRQAGVQIIAPADVLDSMKTEPLKGREEVRAALRHLIANLGLVIASDNGSTIVLRRAPAAAAPTPAATSTDADSVFSAKEIVVTGASTKLAKFSAPYAVSSIKEQAIFDRAPRSLVDLTSGQPSIYAENSGGEGGGENITIRGLPWAGFRLIDVLEDGLPLYESNFERFMNIDELFRVDMMTQRAEIVRGGTAPIFSNNASDGVLNVITRHGTETPEGAAEIEVGSRNRIKVSAYESGPITDNLLFSVGGSYRRDDGLRDQHFGGADDGGQLKAGISYNLAHAKLFADVKYLNDKSIFYTDIPLTSPTTGASLNNLINQSTGTLDTDAFKTVQLRTLSGGQPSVVSRDLNDGIHPQVFTATFGGDFDFDNGWKMTDRARFVDGRVEFNGIFNGATPSDAAAFLASKLGAAKSAFSGVASLGYTVLGSNAVYNPATTANLVMANNFESVRTEFRNEMNDVRFLKSFDLGSFGKHDVTFGFDISAFRYQQQLLIGSILENVENNPDGLNIVAYNASGQQVGSVTENGFISYGSGANGGSLDGLAISGYALDTVHLTSQWEIDAGFRSEDRDESGLQDVIGTVAASTTGPLAARSIQGVVGEAPHHENRHGTAYTLGSGYDFTPELNGFLRYTRSYSYPRFDDILTGALLPNGHTVPVSTIDQAETGVKWAIPTFQASIVAYYAHFNQLSSSTQVAAANGNITTSSVLFNTTTTGVEGEIDWRPLKAFDLSASATVQDPKIDGIQTLTGLSAQSSNNDTITRTPKYMVSVEPSYLFEAGGWHGKAFANGYWVGKRYQDASNLSVLPAYSTLNLGLALRPNPRTELRILADNVTNSTGLTEGNARASVLNTGTVGDATVGRPLFGRNYTASLVYHW